jgi:F0F1-type ATP synthase gamma subunit
MKFVPNYLLPQLASTTKIKKSQKHYQQIVKFSLKLSKIVEKLSKKCQKVGKEVAKIVKKLSKNVKKKLSKNCQKM